MKIFKLFQFKRRTGFTMMEALTTMALISIVSSIILPTIDSFFAGIRVKADAEMFVQNVRMARYKALEEQAVYRLIFADAGREFYRVQTHIAFDESGPPYAWGTNGDPGNYTSTNWLDVASEEYFVGNGVEVGSDLLMPVDLYFWPNGMIYDHGDITAANPSPIGEHFIAFKYGNAGIKVLINSMGVFASESFSADSIGDVEAEAVF